jgi:hypothetical protein
MISLEILEGVQSDVKKQLIVMQVGINYRREGRNLMRIIPLQPYIIGINVSHKTIIP